MADTTTISFREYEDLIRLKNTIYDRLGIVDIGELHRWIDRALAVGRQMAHKADTNPLPVTVVVDSTMPPDEVHFVQDGQVVGKITNLYSGYVQVHHVTQPTDESELSQIMHRVYNKPEWLDELKPLLREYRGRPPEAAPDVPLGELTAEKYFTRLGAEWDPSHREIL